MSYNYSVRKKLIFLFADAALVLFVLLSFSGRVTAIAATDSAAYARLPSDTALYYASGEGYEVKVFLPKTYYVTLLGTNSYYYRVSYGDITGYVRQTAVETVDYEPVIKSALGAAALKSGIASVFLYEDAGLSRIAATVNADTAVGVYGYINSSSHTYYCRISSGGSYIYGYLPTAGVDVVMPDENDGSRIQPPPPENGGGSGDPAETAPPASDIPVQIILVACLVVPSIIIVLLLFSDKKRKDKKSDAP